MNRTFLYNYCRGIFCVVRSDGTGCYPARCAPLQRSASRTGVAPGVECIDLRMSYLDPPVHVCINLYIFFSFRRFVTFLFPRRTKKKIGGDGPALWYVLHCVRRSVHLSTACCIKGTVMCGRRPHTAVGFHSTLRPFFLKCTYVVITFVPVP